MKQAGENSNSLKMVFRKKYLILKQLFQRQSLMRLSMPIQKQEAILRRILKEKIKR